jgi:hypothetical protein
VIEARPVPHGTEVLVVSLLEYNGFPQALSTWQTFSAQLERAATEAGISVQRGQHGFTYFPPPANTLERGSWRVG